ncbi:MAG TPA: tetratricopeptide repeat protein [Burkholderiales bacterium]|nr:tetratricopeptide repeat protein [Burkholderiales bacterium]
MESLFRTAIRMLRRTAPDHGAETPGQVSGRALLESAFQLHRSGRLAEAQPLYRSAIANDPTLDAAHNLLGAVLCAQGQFADGEACFRKALDLNPSSVEALNNLAGARKDQGDVPGAEAIYRRVLDLRPDFPAAWNNLGLIHIARGRPDDAERCFRRALATDGQASDAHNNLGTVLRKQGLLAEAEAEFRAAVAANPDLPEAWSGLGDVLPLRGLLDEAEACCRRALELRADYPDATNNLATIARMRGRLDAAQAYCEEVLRVDSGHVGALNNLGGIAAMRADYAAAEAAYRGALRIDPGNAATRFNLSATLLMLGNYAEGFALYESRFEAFPGSLTRSSALDERLASRPRWRGEPLNDRRLLVWAEQGLGDCIMMLRYLPLLRGRGVGAVTVVCDAALARLVGAMSVAEQVLSPDQIDEALDFDVHCPLMSLPRAFDTRLETIPDRVPYLTIPQVMIAAWRERLIHTKPKVGIAWAGAKTLRDDARRSIPLEQFASLLSLGEVQFVSLQKGDAAADWRQSGLNDVQPIDACNDLLDTAGLVMNLDLVISVDSAVAHLAGALGRPVWLLNRFGSEWRWGLEAQDSRWYPSMRIFREPAPGRWSAVIGQMALQLVAPVSTEASTNGNRPKRVQP